MSNPSLTGIEAKSSALTDRTRASHVEFTDGISSKRIKLSAGDLLATVSGRRISMSEIEFVFKGSQEGACGNVVVATFVRPGGRGDEGEKVAVKKLRLVLTGGMTEEKFLRIFLNELRVLDKLSHPNIVEIIGFVEDIENRIAWLVSPMEQNGNLREFLRSGEWKIDERLSLIRDVALGLDYLHTRRPPICHGDLKSLNILVNSSNRAVIAEIGWARITRQIGEVGATPGTYPPASTNSKPTQLSITMSDTTLILTGPSYSFCWLPREALNGELVDLATDIWALGWIAWEAITDCYPFEELKRELDITMRTVEGQPPFAHDHLQRSQIDRLCSMMQKCWKLEPRERPSATECKRILQWMPSVVPVVKSGEQSTIRSATLLRHVGEMHRLGERREEASKAYREGLAIARLAGDQATVGRTLIQRAKNEQGWSKYIEAEASYTEARGVFETIGFDLGQADALHGTGYMQQMQSKYIEAEASYAQALAIYESIQSDLGRANILLELGDVQEKLSKVIKAEASYTQALAICENIGNNLNRARASFGIGKARGMQSKWVEGVVSFTQALAILEKIGENVNRHTALLAIGIFQGKQSKYVEAETSITQALVFFNTTNDDFHRIGSYLELSRIRLRQARYAEAKMSIENAATISEQIAFEYGKISSKRLLDQVLEAERLGTEPTPPH